LSIKNWQHLLKYCKSVEIHQAPLLSGQNESTKSIQTSSISFKKLSAFAAMALTRQMAAQIKTTNQSHGLLDEMNLRLFGPSDSLEMDLFIATVAMPIFLLQIVLYAATLYKIHHLNSLEFYILRS
jgi:hypothetical protein